MKKIIFVNIIILLSSIRIFSQCSQIAAINTTQREYDSSIVNEITVQLSLDKKTYLENETIILIINIKNVGSTVDSLKNFSEYGFVTNIKLVNELGVKFLYSGMTSYGPEKYVKIKPEEETEIISDLLSAYGSKVLETWNPSKSRYLPIGNYNIEILPNKIVFGKEFRSNELIFEIVKPTGMDSIAMQELRELYKLESSVEAMLKYREFVFKYPESAYMDQSLINYIRGIRISGYEMKYCDTIINDSKWYIDKHPNSSFTPYILKYCIELLEKYKGKSETTEYLQKIALLYGDKRTGIEVRKILDKKNRTNE